LPRIRKTQIGIAQLVLEPPAAGREILPEVTDVVGLRAGPREGRQKIATQEDGLGPHLLDRAEELSVAAPVAVQIGCEEARTHGDLRGKTPRDPGGGQSRSTILPRQREILEPTVTEEDGPCFES
jgi:hypothetical protein